ncbi:hypothetical protein G9F71_008695 [Clostridium sp. FP2]|nr:hypothetical protein [Clostridium sp. FP2]MBZ9622931.1 hypothetical protein [Clostridium sp. FP2]
MLESDIQSYMDQFNVDRKAAIEGIEEYYAAEDRKMYETQQDLIRSTH